jgi:hypothetical protein
MFQEPKFNFLFIAVTQIIFGLTDFGLAMIIVIHPLLV